MDAQPAMMTPVVIRPWPRRLDEREAAIYLGISASKFREGYQADPPRYPRPQRDGRNVLWDIKVLDAHVDAESGLPSSSPLQVKPAGGKERKWGG